MSVRRAQATLARAASFWADQSAGLGGWDEPGAAIRARYTANCFRELDGFLRCLLDELAPVAGPRQRNTANKLDAVASPRGRPDDGRRLRAIGRSAACLFHCGGLVRRPDVAAGDWMTAGWPGPDDPALRRYPLGDRLRPGSREVADVCGFFLRVGEEIA